MKRIQKIMMCADVTRTALLVCIGLLSIQLVSAQSMSDYESYPPYVAEQKDPLVMLAMSLDHQLFYKAYTDYDDLYDDPSTAADDNIPETTYTPQVDYIGYFDHSKCYQYDSTNKYFKPVGMASSAMGGFDAGNPQYCSNAWSGNFLNWLSMTRVDVVRKVLYGGKRVVDDQTNVILERAYLPNDAHSFAKYYEGDDIAYLVPTAISGLPILTESVSCGVEPSQAASDSVWDTYVACKLNKGITFCNTTVDRTNNQFSQDSTAEPLIRAVKGNYSLWAANDRYQCLYGLASTSYSTSEIKNANSPAFGKNQNEPRENGFYAHSENPAPGTGIGDYVARVKVCDINQPVGEEDCKEYEDASGNVHYKPVGLLQQFGDDDEKGMSFGLITGSYKYNKSFGKLRKNIGSISDEIDQNNGAFLASAKGIVSTLNSVRIANYLFNYSTEASNYYKGNYNLATGDNCDWNITGFVDGQCTNWGNPFSEIMFEGYRYLAGASGPYTAQAVKDSTLGGVLAGISEETSWNTSVSDLECKSLNIVGFNASSVSYDGDIKNVNLATAGIGTQSKTVAQVTNELSADELVPGTQYFVGEIDGDTSFNGKPEQQQCTAKNVTNLADVRGICPDSPRLSGSYLMAGLAQHSRNHGVRGAAGSDGEPVTTFGVSLAPAIPSISIPVPGRTSKPIVVQPACRNMANSGTTFIGNCAIVDLKVIQPHSVADGTGKIFVIWEANEQGGDYDSDISGTISYKVTSTQLELVTNVREDSTGAKVGFGYVISGLGNVHDGFYTPGSSVDGDGDRDYSVTGKYGCPHSVTGSVCALDAADPLTSIHTLTISSENAANSVAFLEQPLYYAAKWGGNLTESGDPIMKDGKPETYYDVRNPSQLQKQMNDLFNNLANKENAASASGVAVNDTSYNRMVVQTVFYPLFRSDDETINWVGGMHSLLITQEQDASGRLRAYLVEDTNQNGLLDDSDKRIDRVGFDESANKTFAYMKDGGTVEISELAALWNASNELDSVTDYVTQRNWGSNANSGRYLVTAIDKNGDGQIKNDEQIPFEADQFSGLASVTKGRGKDNYRYLDVSSGTAADAQKIVNFVRGDESEASFRSRTITKGGTAKSYLIGDIVHSTPLIVGSPKGNFYEVHGDSDYLDFYQKYYSRRNVAYVGANDGMLHAFNAGFPSESQQGFEKTHNNGTAAVGDDPYPHDLGAELWGYVPFNLLPHLKWLTDKNYTHVAYVDGSPQVFDVKIFDENADSRHVGDWGTILVVGMRLGGGPYNVDPDGTGGTASQTLRSAYVILDVTDPEQPPRVLGEITHPNLGYTTGDVDVIYRNGSWRLVFGSGPTGSNALDQATSNQNARLFTVNLNNLAAGTVTLSEFDTGMANAFVGGVRGVDWDTDFNSDAVYFGLVGGRNADGTKREGSLMRARVNDYSLVGMGTFVSGLDAAFAETPVTVTDGDRNLWVYAGTGRFYVDDDDKNSGEYEAYYGVKESADILESSPTTLGAIPLNKLMDVSAVQVNLKGDLYVSGVKGNVSVTNMAGESLQDGSGSAVSVGSHEALAEAMTTQTVTVSGSDVSSPIRGWVKTYRNVGELTVTKTIVDPLLYSLVFSTYTPTITTSACPVPGNARSYSLDLRTGIFNGYYTNISLDPSDPNDQDTPLTEEDTVVADNKLNDPVIIPELDVKVNDNVEAELNFEGKRTTTVESGRRTWQEIPLDRFYTW